MIMRADQLDIARALVLVIDVQDKLVPHIRHHKRTTAASRKLLDGARIFNLPVVATEQYPKGLGSTIKPIARCLEAAGATILEKPTFSAWAHPPLRDVFVDLDRPQIIVIGVETHVCVQQTVLDLLSRDYDVFVCADATGSRGATDHKLGLQRMRHSGALVTTVESALFELCGRCDTTEFKAMIEIIKTIPPGDD